MLLHRLLRRCVGVLCLGLLAAPVLAQGAPDITAVEPSTGTEGTEFLVSGTGFGNTLPKLFFARDGEKLGGTKLRTLELLQPEGDEDPQLRVRVDRAITGSFQLGLQVKGKLPVISEVEFEVLAPNITSLEPFLAAPPGLFTLEVENATTAGARVYFGTRRAKVISFGPPSGGSSQIVVRLPKLAAAPWDVNFRSRVGQSVLHQALVVPENSVKKLGPQRMQWSADGPAERSRGSRFSTAPDQLGRLRITGKARVDDATLRMIVEIPESVLESFTEPVTLSALQSSALVVRTPDGQPSTIYLSDDFAALDAHSVFLNVVTDTHIALSFFSTVQKQIGATADPDDLFTEGTLVVRR
ncbi:MAG: hypothetical protein DHS20C15_28940 [Planctomycetota bacterium]|nr:MAG: hypothetical protein DHS20C15_28940 [Planctomycetota bacterium]